MGTPGVSLYVSLWSLRGRKEPRRRASSSAFSVGWSWENSSSHAVDFGHFECLLLYVRTEVSLSCAAVVAIPPLPGPLTTKETSNARTYLEQTYISFSYSCRVRIFFSFVSRWLFPLSLALADTVAVSLSSCMYSAVQVWRESEMGPSAVLPD